MSGRAHEYVDLVVAARSDVVRPARVRVLAGGIGDRGQTVIELGHDAVIVDLDCLDFLVRGLGATKVKVLVEATAAGRLATVQARGDRDEVQLTLAFGVLTDPAVRRVEAFVATEQLRKALDAAWEHLCESCTLCGGGEAG